jgi:hypothetical protein
LLKLFQLLSSNTVVDYIFPCAAGHGRHGQRFDGVFAIAISQPYA